jgi:hypothetical protein
MHFYKLAVFTRLCSQITQIVFDVFFGMVVLYLIAYYTKEVLETVHFFG